MFSRKAPPHSVDEVVQIERNLNAFTVKLNDAKHKLAVARKENATKSKLTALFRAYKSIERQTTALESALALIENAKGVAVITQAQQTATKVIKSVTKDVDHEAINDAHHETAEMLNDATTSLMALPVNAEDVDDELDAFFANELPATEGVKTDVVLKEDMPSIPTHQPALSNPLKNIARIKVYNGGAKTASRKNIA